MAIDKKLDTKWYWLGYTCGANTRKEIKEMPNKITNLGERGISLIPTETQRVSFFIGMLVGRGKLVQNFDVVKILQYQDKKSRKKGDYLTLGMTEVKGNKGQIVKMPLIISNNSVDNRGYIGFQAKISYPTQYLTFTNLIKSNSSLSTLKYLHDAGSGIVQIQGMMESVEYSDKVQVFLEFRISNNCPTSQTITLNGPTGIGQGSDILTLISGENYYIQPLTLENGLIKLPDQQGNYAPTIPYTETIPSIGDNYDYYSGSTSLTYDFDLSLSYGGNRSGGGQGGGASLGVMITFGDGSSQTVYIPVSEGSHHYSGKIPITLPSMKQGPIKITIWVEGEDEDDLWYWFIKAGALWGFETEIDRNDVGEYEETQIGKPKEYFDFLKLFDFVDVVIEGYGEIVSNLEIGESLRLFDYQTYIRNRDWVLDVFEKLGIKDDIVVDGAGIVINNILASEIMQFLDSFNFNIIGDVKSNTSDGLGFSDGVEIEII